ncbi:NRDE family protein [Halorarius litoreus]|uniref:NRDE family protein n=1 Tax=Halorarius litoreus TaxID=2962676 RepID=UPI0020CCD162|nr:NRDE family protein [Halorarius litoreus]
MCTLAFAWQVFDDYLTVAANRDEALARPSSPPTVRGENPRVLAPRDEEAGGTWVGYNEHGTFVALTNRWTREPSEGDRSRGLLVRETLDQPTTTEAVAFVRSELAARTYEPFHLVVADADRAVLFDHDTTTSETRLAPGVYVVGNTGWCGERWGPVDATARQRTETFFEPGMRPEIGRQQAANDRMVLDALVEATSADEADAWLDAGSEILSDHDYGVCLHPTATGVEEIDAAGGFGTKSSTLIRLGATRTYRHAEGPPCENAYQSVDPL